MIGAAAALVILTGSSAKTNTATTDPSTAIAALRAATADGAETKGVAQQDKDAALQQKLQRFQQGISQAKTLEAALKDPRVLDVLMPALGLDGQQSYPGKVYRLLTADPSDEKSAVSKLADSTWTAANKTLNLSSGGLAALKSAATLTDITDNYKSFSWRSSLDNKALGVSDALYLKEQASTVTDVYSILGNSVLRRVVTGALDIPDEIAIQPVATQAKAISSKLDISKLSDSNYVNKLLERYVANRASENTTSTAGTSSLLSLFS
ncbi:DUF1217 domain-containing protein [Roseomonas elaeocarpi]|uniref:DUF1217 domain-containing protein n=1 Tax=Roseomonas elaeocarpi TaxID=907779 RepID=A0ABV6JSP5_9PROT